MAAQKPTKQQVAQAKARAGGNNPVKVTNAGLKKLGSAAVIAASFTPVGRGVKVASIAAKPIAAAARNAAGKKVVSATMGKAAAEKYATAAAKRTAQRTQTAADLKNAKTFASPSKASVQVKPAKKNVGNPPNPAKMEEEKISSFSRGGRFGPLGKDKTKRVVSSKNPTGKSK